MYFVKIFMRIQIDYLLALEDFCMSTTFIPTLITITYKYAENRVPPVDGFRTCRCWFVASTKANDRISRF